MVEVKKRKIGGDGERLAMRVDIQFARIVDGIHLMHEMPIDHVKNYIIITCLEPKEVVDTPLALESWKW